MHQFAIRYKTIGSIKHFRSTCEEGYRQTPCDTKGNQQDHKILGQNDNQRSGTRLSQNKSTIFSLDCCHQRQFSLKYYQLLDQSSFSYAQLHNKESREKDSLFQEIQFCRYWQTHCTKQKNYNFNCCIIQLPNNFALCSAQWGVILCMNGKLGQIRISSSTRSWI